MTEAPLRGVFVGQSVRPVHRYVVGEICEGRTRRTLASLGVGRLPTTLECPRLRRERFPTRGSFEGVVREGIGGQITFAQIPEVLARSSVSWD